MITICTRLTSPSSAIMRLAWSGLLATLFGLVTLLAFPAVASAQVMHAEYVSSDPKASSVLKTAPTKITIHFSEELNPTGSTISVYDVDYHPAGKDGSVQVNRNDLKTMTVDLQPNTSSEVYVVNWSTVAADDGHHDAGSFRFFVNPDPALTDAVHANSPSGTNTSQANTSSSSGGLPVWSAPLIGVVALLVGGLAGVFLVGRRVQQK